MPESNATAKKRQQKANRAAGIGDEQGRLIRVKEAPKMSQCSICQLEMKITKTNTELDKHASGKHGKTVEECFPGAAEVAAELIAAASKGKGGSSKGSSGDGGLTKAQKKKKAEANMDDLLSAGLSANKKKGKK